MGQLPEDLDPVQIFLERRRWTEESRARLFACAICREPGVWNRLSDEFAQRAVDVAERYAHGDADDLELSEVAAALGSRSSDDAQHAQRKISVSAQADRVVSAALCANGYEGAERAILAAENLLSRVRLKQMISYMLH